MYTSPGNAHKPENILLTYEAPTTGIHFFDFYSLDKVKRTIGLAYFGREVLKETVTPI
jgi:hypothetical protein